MKLKELSIQELRAKESEIQANLIQFEKDYADEWLIIRDDGTHTPVEVAQFYIEEALEEVQNEIVARKAA